MHEMVAIVTLPKDCMWCNQKIQKSNNPNNNPTIKQSQTIVCKAENHASN
jgi:biotin synthase-like enzyme